MYQSINWYVWLIAVDLCGSDWTTGNWNNKLKFNMTWAVSRLWHNSCRTVLEDSDIKQELWTFGGILWTHTKKIHSIFPHLKKKNLVKSPCHIWTKLTMCFWFEGWNDYLKNETDPFISRRKISSSKLCSDNFSKTSWCDCSLPSRNILAPRP